MRERIILGTFSLALLALPLLSLAQSASCPVLTRMLTLGSEGEDVRVLQRFLTNEGELISGTATGNFGLTTENAVKSWQWSKRIVTSKDDAGFGIVGPKTRAAITAICKTTTSPSTGNPNLPYFTPSSTTSPKTVGGDSAGKCTYQVPKSVCATSWQGKRGSDGCVASWYCISISSRTFTSTSSTLVSPFVNGSTTTPTISGVSCTTPLGVVVQSGQTFTDQSIKYICTNGQWFVYETSSATTTVSTSTTATSSAGVGSQFKYWCPNGIGGLGYWSQTVCPTNTNTGGTYGSSANVQAGVICAPEGRQEFVACPYMSNCFQGGTYLICKNAIWTPFN